MFPLIVARAHFHLAVPKCESIHLELGVLVRLAFDEQPGFAQSQDPFQPHAILKPDFAMAAQGQTEGAGQRLFSRGTLGDPLLIAAVRLIPGKVQLALHSWFLVRAVPRGQAKTPIIPGMSPGAVLVRI